MFRLSRFFSHGSYLNNYLHNSYRTLYSANTLGINGFVEKREKVKQYFVNDADKFREKMIDSLENGQNSMVFTEDLKNMIHLANDKDLDLLEKMLKKFNKQSKEIRFGNFIFGTVVMRFIHHINNPDFALKLFKDPELNSFFDQLMTYQILVDMLYEQGRYQDVVDVFEIIKSRQIQGGMHPRHVVLLVFAACYKENTPESFKYAMELWSELNNIGHIPMRRAITFAATLAIKQNAPHIALEIVGTARQQQYVTVRNIKVLAFTNLGRPDDALPILKSVLQGTDETTKQSFTKDVMDNLKESINKSGNNELVQQFSRLEQFLMENGHVVDKTLDDLLTTEIDTITRQNDSGSDRNLVAASYNNNYNNYNRGERNQNYGYKTQKFSGRPNRPGLADID